MKALNNQWMSSYTRHHLARLISSPPFLKNEDKLISDQWPGNTCLWDSKWESACKWRQSSQSMLSWLEQTSKNGPITLSKGHPCPAPSNLSPTTPLRVRFLSKEGPPMVKQSQCPGLGQVPKPWPRPAMGQVAESKAQWPFAIPLGVCWRLRAVQRRLTVSALWPALWEQRKEKYLTQEVVPALEPQWTSIQWEQWPHPAPHPVLSLPDKRCQEASTEETMRLDELGDSLVGTGPKVRRSQSRDTELPSFPILL